MAKVDGSIRNGRKENWKVEVENSEDKYRKVKKKLEKIEIHVLEDKT